MKKYLPFVIAGIIPVTVVEMFGPNFYQLLGFKCSMNECKSAIELICFTLIVLVASLFSGMTEGDGYMMVPSPELEAKLQKWWRQTLAITVLPGVVGITRFIIAFQ